MNTKSLAHSRCLIKWEIFIIEEGRVRQAHTALEPDVLGSAEPLLPFTEHLLCAGGFLFFIANPGNNFRRKAKFVGGTEVRRPDVRPSKADAKCSAR